MFFGGIGNPHLYLTADHMCMEFLSGHIYTREGLVDGYLCIENGTITAIEEGKCPKPPVAEGLIIPPQVNGHTHCADGGLKVAPGISLEDLVAPPDGLKHIYLQNTADEFLKNSMRQYGRMSSMNGIGTFIDFREGGVRGCKMLREASPSATVLGRPISPEYDPGEVDAILDISDGIGLPSISDMDGKYIEHVADHARRRKKIFAIHASERIREDIDTILSLDPSFLVHMTQATDGDLLKCAESEVPIVVCARSNMYFGMVPPIKRMLDCGADIAPGTDNAMLCDPDLRSEMSVMWDILKKQGGESDDMWNIMMANGRKLLYCEKEIALKIGTAADLAVMPYSGNISLDSVLGSGERIIRFDRTNGELK